MNYSFYPRNDVLCIDMRSFYASVEAVKRGLDPMKVMLAVVGDTNRPGSIVLAASPALKQKYGVRNVSRFFELPNDPDMYIVNANMADYLQVSISIVKFLYQYAPQEAIHPYSVDEIWMTVNGLEKLFGSRWEIARRIKHDMLQQFNLTCSIGIGDNKFLAKVVMDLHAKKTGIAECKYEDVETKLWPFPIETIWGIGKRMKRHLNHMGIVTLGQLANGDRKQLKKRFGVIGEQLYWHAWGIDLSPVFGDFLKSSQKSFGHGITLLRDYSATEALIGILDLCEEVCHRARTHHQAGKTIHLSVVYSKETESGFSRSQSLPFPTNNTMEVYHICTQLFQRFYNGTSMVRKMYVALTNLTEQRNMQLDLFEKETKKEKVGYVMDAIRDKYGATAILRASSYTEAGILLERSQKIGGHYATSKWKENTK